MLVTTVMCSRGGVIPPPRCSPWKGEARRVVKNGAGECSLVGVFGGCAREGVSLALGVEGEELAGCDGCGGSERRGVRGVRL